MDNILTSISDLFLGNGIVIIIGCMIVGLFVKGSFKKVPNKYIPFINIGISIILGFAIPGTFEDKDIVSKVIILMFLGLSSVGLYESLCIILKDRFSIDIKKIVSKFSNTNNDLYDGSESLDEESNSEVSANIEATNDELKPSEEQEDPH